MDVLSLDLPGIPKLRSGKVREVFDLDDSLLLVATDRISAFDCVLPNAIPRKGQVLTQLSRFWFDRFSLLIPNHLIASDVSEFPPELCAQLSPASRAALDGRAMLVHRTEVVPFE